MNDINSSTNEGLSKQLTYSLGFFSKLESRLTAYVGMSANIDTTTLNSVFTFTK